MLLKCGTVKYIMAKFMFLFCGLSSAITILLAAFTNDMDWFIIAGLLMACTIFFRIAMNTKTRRY